MSLPALVLVHGGAHAADCWDLTIDEIHRLAPELTVLAVDLPGRRGKPGDLRTLTIADCVNSIVADIEDAGLDDVVIVGHSMAGLTVPGVVTKLAASRVREMILAAACVPGEGDAMVDVMSALVPYQLPPIAPRFMFLTGFHVRDGDSWWVASIPSPRSCPSRRCPTEACPATSRAPGF
jgi:pimeloyl-ACP methyl ester carboxylesterase